MKTFSLLVWLMSEVSLLPPTGPCVSSRCTCVFQCAVETLCGAATFSLPKWPAWGQKLTHTGFHAEQKGVNSVAGAVRCDCLSQFCTALCFWLLYVNCYDVAKVQIKQMHHNSVSVIMRELHCIQHTWHTNFFVTQLLLPTTVVKGSVGLSGLRCKTWQLC